MKPETRAAFAAAQRAFQTAYELLQRECLETIKANDAPDLVRFYADASEEADVMRETMSAVAKLEKDLSYTAIPSCFDTHGIQNVRVQGYGLVSLNRRWSCSILEGKREEGHQYLRDTGQGGMIIETVNSQTLGAYAHHYSDERGKDLPEDIFKTTVARYVSLRGAK